MWGHGCHFPDEEAEDGLTHSARTGQGLSGGQGEGEGERRGPGSRGYDKKLYATDGASVLANGPVGQHVGEGVGGWALDAPSLASRQGLRASGSRPPDALPALGQAEFSLSTQSRGGIGGGLRTGSLASLPVQAGMTEVVPETSRPF